MNIIELDKINKSFKTKYVSTHAINDVSLNVKEGEFVSITGPSGCGKSTLLSILGLLDTFDTGSYKLANVLVSKLNASQKAHVRNKHIGFIFQSFNLINELSAIENVCLPLQFLGVMKKEALEKAELVLSKVGLLNRINHFPPQLSGGQQQRVAVARALVTSPDIILADEPTGNLDVESSNQVMDILLELNKAGQTILMVTHNSDIAKSTSKIVNILDGCII